MGLTAYIAGVEKNFYRVKTQQKGFLKYWSFFTTYQGTEQDATGYKGFYYHFLDMQTGRRAWNCELSTIDTTFMQGALSGVRG